jgi:polar amino acid transport system substrate-binding protein
MTRPIRMMATALGAVAVLLAGCAGPSGSVGSAAAPGEAAQRHAAAAPVNAPLAVPRAATDTSCGNPEQSYDPVQSLPSDALVQRIKKNQRLVAGVSADTYLFGARNPFTDQIEGFDIDLVHAIAAAVLGDPNKVTLKVISASQRIPFLQDGTVDIVVRTMTTNCARWKQIGLSAVYFQAGQSVMVSTQSKATSMAGLNGKRVCAPAGTTSLDNLKQFPKVKPVAVQFHTDCLALFQEGKVDAITGDNAILAGFVAQDPYAKIVSAAPFTKEPYAIGVSQKYPEFVAFVNGVLAKLESDGSWQRAYAKWLAGPLGRQGSPPQPVYGRQP